MYGVGNDASIRDLQYIKKLSYFIVLAYVLILDPRPSHLYINNFVGVNTLKKGRPGLNIL